MTRINVLALLFVLLFPLSVMAGSDPIKSAESAGPPDLTSKATIKDWNGKILRKGSNGWTLPAGYAEYTFKRSLVRRQILVEFPGCLHEQNQAFV